MQVQQAGDPNWSVDGEAWLAWPIRQRWLASFRRAVAAHGREIAQVIADEIGKPESEAYVSEVLPLLAATTWAAATRQNPEKEMFFSGLIYLFY